MSAYHRDEVERGKALAKDIMQNGLIVSVGPGEAMRLARAVVALAEVEHMAWHLLDGSEERVSENEIVVGRDDYEALSKLLPEDHP